MKKVAIVQSNYIPWKGYFDLINSVDEFILYDDAQYTRRDWRNRNKIMTSQGVQWLTIPVNQVDFEQKIIDTTVSDKSWSKKHWKSITQNYSKATFFEEYRREIENLYMDCQEDKLSNINYNFITTINKILGIKTKIRWSGEFELVEGKTMKLLDICKQCGADTYLSGPAAKDYFDMELAKEVGIKVEWMDYSGYPDYRQLHKPFEHGVTVLDLIFNEGPNAVSFMKTFNK
ncbi:hypothetical protein EIK76_03380 [Rheinheimera mesophila]|uniref:WbqC family protein n=1 Tax=Rheinheimera mesophila TaxID=1547515 RepID=A0A3P3QRR3_9GAMM|nr:WbqC family protein [Rheinheimera mesophila]KKL00434.1 hypothetical protein SD53_14875 [Rheinheimera mesophila]RRJ23140.1 hypothetical protein EIK76_03380 [Rheinheimera mesophila]